MTDTTKIIAEELQTILRAIGLDTSISHTPNYYHGGKKVGYVLYINQCCQIILAQDCPTVLTTKKSIIINTANLDYADPNLINTIITMIYEAITKCIIDAFPHLNLATHGAGYHSLGCNTDTHNIIIDIEKGEIYASSTLIGPKEEHPTFAPYIGPSKLVGTFDPSNPDFIQEIATLIEQSKSVTSALTPTIQWN